MRSLASRHPWRLDVPLLLALAVVLLAQGLTMPAMEIRALIFWVDRYSILSNIYNLYQRGRHSAAVLLAACSVAYPALKILALLFLWLVPCPPRARRRLVRGLRLLGRWSMVDVFAITAIVLASQTVGFLVDARPLPGIYVFAAAILVLTVATMLLDGIARRGR